MVVVRIAVFSEGDTSTFAVADLTVLNNPALAPVRPDHTVLESGRWSPCGSCFIDVEAAYGDIADPFFGRHEAFTAYVNLNIFLIWVSTWKFA